MLLLRAVVNHFPSQKLERKKLILYLLDDCLFQRQELVVGTPKKGTTQTAGGPPPKCKNSTTRQMALELLREICLEYEEGMHLLSKQMKNLFAEASWRCKKRSDWAITPNE